MVFSYADQAGKAGGKTDVSSRYWWTVICYHGYMGGKRIQHKRFFVLFSVCLDFSRFYYCCLSFLMLSLMSALEWDNDRHGTRLLSKLTTISHRKGFTSNKLVANDGGTKDLFNFGIGGVGFVYVHGWWWLRLCPHGNEFGEFD